MRRGVSPIVLVLLGLAAFIPASDLAVALVNRVVDGAARPPSRCRASSSPRGIPAGSANPRGGADLLTSDAEIEEQVERLEIHYLANPDGAIHFALLSDWMDAPTETTPADDGLLAAAIDGHRPAQSAPWPRARRGGAASCCSTAGGSGTRARASGWDGSASAASSRS